MTVFGTGNPDAGRDARAAHATPKLAGTPIEVVVVLKSAPHWPSAFPVTQLKPWLCVGASALP
jgi:hypothetical protein